jgi:glucose-6-phosphate 1-dehydrogenase
MEPPPSGDEHELCDRKIDVLRSIRLLTSRRARYGAGRLADHGGANGAEVPAYADEDGVDPTRGTETFAELTVDLETKRWQGTPVVLRGGKALRRLRKGVVIRFRSNEGEAANDLWVGIDGPYDIVLRLGGDPAGRIAPVELRGDAPAVPLPAYAHVLLDVLGGGNTLSVRGDGAEQAWRVVTPVIEAWCENRVPLQEYPAGSDGPCR